MASILDYLQRYADVIAPYPPNVYIVCPSCHTRKKKCSIHVNKGIGACFRASCELHSGFNFPKLITKVQNVSLSEAYSIAAKYNEGVEYDYKAKSFGLNRDYPKGSLPVEEFINYVNFKDDTALGYLAQHGVRYLNQTRGLTEEQMVDYQLGIGYENITIQETAVPRYGMIVIPIFFNNEIVSYTSRSIEAYGMMLGSIKHYFPQTVEEYLTTGQILFNCDKAIPAARKSGNLIIVEDAWSSIKLNCCSSLGTKLTDDQIFILLNNYGGRITLLYDNDTGGKKATQSNALALSRYRSDVYIAQMKNGIDPDDNLPAAIEAVEQATLFNPFLSSLSKYIN